MRNALTTEQWMRHEYSNGRLSVEPWSDKAGFSIYVMDGATIYDKMPIDVPVELSTEDRHATAALCLYGQPFGFTYNEAQVLRLIATKQPQYAKPLVELAEKIEALLPPPHVPQS